MKRFAVGLFLVCVLLPELAHADNIRLKPRDVASFVWAADINPVPISADVSRISFDIGGRTMNDVVLMIGVPTPDQNDVTFVSRIPAGHYAPWFQCHHQNGNPCGNAGKKKGMPFRGGEFINPTPGTDHPMKVPEPSSLILLGVSVGALGLGRRALR